MKRIKGDGTFKIRGNRIHVHGSINGIFYRKSTGKKVSPATKKWIEKADPLKVLVEILGINIDGSSTCTDLKDIGIEALEMQYAAKKMTISHHEDKLSAFNNKILPHFKDIPIENISVKDIVSWINLLKDSYSFTHVKFIKNLYKSIFDYAKNDLRLIDYSPFDSTTIQNIDLSWTATTESYTTKEVALILKESIGWLKVFLDLSVKYGFRPGEITVFQWKDIDFQNGLLYLSRARNADNIIVEYNTVKGNKNHFRTIALFESSVKLLKNYYEVRENRIWMFINKNNKPFTHSQSIIDYHLNPLLKELKIEYKTLYALRRSYASIMKYAGQNIEDIQKIMGHKEGSAVTEKHYITDDILTVEDRKKQSKKQEDLFNILVQLEDEEDD